MNENEFHTAEKELHGVKERERLPSLNTVAFHFLARIQFPVLMEQNSFLFRLHYFAVSFVKGKVFVFSEVQN